MKKLPPSPPLASLAQGLMLYDRLKKQLKDLIADEYLEKNITREEMLVLYEKHPQIVPDVLREAIDMLIAGVK